MCSPDVLETALTSRTVFDKSAKKMDMVTPLKAHEAYYSRDALAKALFDRLFAWVVRTINEHIYSKSSSEKSIIGVLDIYGFEILRVRISHYSLSFLLSLSKPDFFKHPSNIRPTALSNFASTTATRSCSRFSSNSPSSRNKRSIKKRCLLFSLDSFGARTELNENFVHFLLGN